MADFAHDDYILLANFELQDILNTLHTWGFDRSQFPHFFTTLKRGLPRQKATLLNFHHFTMSVIFLIT